MTNINNPGDSLCSYFDELLSQDCDEFSLDNNETLAAITEKKLTATAAAPYAIVVKKPEIKPALTRPNFADENFSDSAAEQKQKQKLQKLLHSVQPKIETAPLEKIEEVSAPQITTIHFQVDPQEIQDWKIQPVAPVVEVSTPVENSVREAASHAYEMQGLEWLANGLPQWAQTSFDVLLFKVSGLTLAVPLISLGKIRPITGQLIPLLGQADWFMGLQLTTTGKIYTVNTAKFVMPERYDESFAKNAKYVVSINGVPWGLAVDSINQPIRLTPDAVKWRTNRSKRPWLAGTIKEHMCALLDIPMIGQLLMNADKNSVKNPLF